MPLLNSGQHLHLKEWCGKYLTLDSSSSLTMLDLYNMYKKCVVNETDFLPLRRKTFAYLLKEFYKEEMLKSQVAYVYKNQSIVEGLKINSLGKSHSSSSDYV